MNDEELVDRIARGYSPPPMTPRQAARFDAALEVALRPRRLPWLALPALGGLATAAAAVWFALSPSGESPPPPPASEAPLAAAPSDEAPVAAASEGDDGFDAPLIEDTEWEAPSLPGDYEVLALLTDSALGWADEDESWEVP